MVTTPNGEYFRNSLPRFSEIGDPAVHEHAQFSADADGHFFAYVAEELSGVFRDAGLKNVAVSFFESPWISGHVKIRYLHSWMPVSVLRTLDRLSLRLPVMPKIVRLKSISIEGSNGSGSSEMAARSMSHRTSPSTKW